MLLKRGALILKQSVHLYYMLNRDAKERFSNKAVTLVDVRDAKERFSNNAVTLVDVMKFACELLKF